ncbi:hypothetical protein ACA910_002445 [Epithemia clementina (nom. ined.)]
MMMWIRQPNNHGLLVFLTSLLTASTQLSQAACLQILSPTIKGQRPQQRSHTTTTTTTTTTAFVWTTQQNPRLRQQSQRTICCQRQIFPFHLLSSAYLENDLVAVVLPEDKSIQNGKNGDGTAVATTVTTTRGRPCRLGVVKPDGGVVPLCQRVDDVATDLWDDPREFSNSYYWSQQVTDDCIVRTYGEGFYGQRPVPSLGGGPGYGAEADEVWSVDESVLETIKVDGVWLPELDMGIAHGEKARAGAF